MKIKNPIWFIFHIFVICFWIYDIGAYGFNGDKAMVLSLASCLVLEQIEPNNK